MKKVNKKIKYNYHVLYGCVFKAEFKTYAEAKQFVDKKNKESKNNYWHISDVSNAKDISKLFKLTF